ncbi:MAG: NAD-dependent epimerase/dehydratase family protein [Chthoniobacterales bacterium]
MKALVTGATGLVGANLVRELLAQNYEVRALVRPTSDLRALGGLEVETCVGDVLQPETLVSAASGCEIVFHAAAIFSYWKTSAEHLQKIAVTGTRNVLDAASRGGTRRVVLTSSTVVLGSSRTREVRDESSLCNETDAYSLAKMRQEEVAFRCAAHFGLELVAACPAMCLGPNDYRLSPSNAIICSYLKDPFRLTWPGGCNLVSVRDVARGQILLARKGKPGERYILGSENLEWPASHRLISELCGVEGPKFTANHTSAYLAATAQEMISALTRQPPLSTRTQAKMVGRFYWYSSARAQSLGYAPRPARTALAEAAAWLLGSAHLPKMVRTTLRPGREIYRAWEKLGEKNANLPNDGGRV